MSSWNWIHAGLEIATFSQALKAQRNLSDMKNANEIERARQLLLEAMKTFIFDISRDIQLAAEQIQAFPHEVFIVSKALSWRFLTSGISAEIFPDFQDKEYVFKTERLINEVVDKSGSYLNSEQIQQSETAVQYIIEMPLLQRAVSAKSAQESLIESDHKWQTLKSLADRNKLFRSLGLAGLVMSLCLSCFLLPAGLNLLGTGDFGMMMLGVLMLLFAAAIPIGAVGLLVVSSKSNPEYAILKEQRENWQKQLMEPRDWQQVISTFGDLPSQQYKDYYQERQSFLSPILGSEFQNYLTAGN
jgi:hypothetical protein